MDLANKKCVPCEGGTNPLSVKKIKGYLSELSPDWKDIKKKKILREFSFKNFREAIGFVNATAEIAEQEGHHPDIYISYNKVKIVLWTHSIGGLSENDFILASKIDKMYESKNF